MNQSATENYTFSAAVEVHAHKWVLGKTCVSAAGIGHFGGPKKGTALLQNPIKPKFFVYIGAPARTYENHGFQL